MIARACWLLRAALLAPLLASAAGCAGFVGDGYGGGDGGYGDVGGGYYEPSGFDYGGWGSGYYVGPYRGGRGLEGGRFDRDRLGGERGGLGGDHNRGGIRGMPSIPTGHSFGGGHAMGGGGHAGGSGGGGHAGGGGGHGR